MTREAPLSLPIATIATLPMVVGVAIDIGFVTERLTYSKGPLGGMGFYLAELVVLGWLLCANVVTSCRRAGGAWHGDSGYCHAALSAVGR